MLRLERFPLYFPDAPAPRPLGYNPRSRVIWMPNWWTAPRGAHPHFAIDIATASGTPVMSVADGLVTHAGWETMGGWSVMITSELTSGRKAVAYYAHMFVRPQVLKGQALKAGDFIGLVGSTGYSSGPHLHFTVFVESKPGAGDATRHPVNPYPQLLALSAAAGRDASKRVVADDAAYQERSNPAVFSAWREAASNPGQPTTLTQRK